MRLRPVISIPFNHSPYFSGRNDELLRIAKELKREGVCVMHGLGGIGKTQLACEYVFKNISKYKIAYFVNAESDDVIKEALLNLGIRLGIVKEEKKPRVTQKIGDVIADNSEIIINQTFNSNLVGNFNTTLDWLANSKDWILIYDNAENYESIKNYIPNVVKGEIIVTSRHSEWGRLSEFAIEELSLDSAIEMLYRITKLEADEHAKELVKSLGFLPLAIEQAGAYIYVQKISYEKYLELFKASRLALLERGYGYTNSESTVASTWEISLKKIKKENIKAFELLCHCAFLDPVFEGTKEEIPLKLFIIKNAVGNSIQSKKFKTLKIEDEVELRELLNVLGKYSVIKYLNETFSIHRLVQLVTRNELSKDEIVAHIERMQIITELSFDYVEPLSGRQNKENNFYKIALSIVRNSFLYEIYSISLLILSRRLSLYCIYVLNDFSICFEILKKYKNFIDSNPPISPLTWAEYYYIEAAYNLAKGDKSNGVNSIRKSKQYQKKFYLSEYIDKEGVEKCCNFMYGLCNLLDHHEQYVVAEDISVEITAIFFHVDDEKNYYKACRNLLYYLNQQVILDKKIDRIKREKIRHRMREINDIINHNRFRYIRQHAEFSMPWSEIIMR